MTATGNMKPGPLLLLGVVFILIVILGWWLGIPKVVPNSEFYIQVATGHGESVARPFSTRVLHQIGRASSRERV